MSDGDSPAEVVNDVAENAADDTGAEVPVVDPDPPSEDSGDHPENCVHCAKIDSLKETVDSISDKLADSVDPGSSETVADDAIEDVQDVSPAKGPWTHRNPFGRD